MKTKNKKNIVWHIIFILIIIISLYPIIFSISNSFKPLKDAYHTILDIIPKKITLENYKYLFESLPIFKITFNTFIAATAITLIKLFISFFASYAIVYGTFKGKRLLYFIFIGTMFVPFTVTMIPNYLIISKLGLIDKIWGIILPQLADAMGIFLLTQTMRSIPKSLIEVAKLDNLKDRTIMRGIVFPLSKHAVYSTGIWFFITAWNEYVWPVLVLKTTENYTLPLALQNFISSEGGTNFSVAMAVSVIAMILPLALYLVFQKYIIGTFVSAGVK